MTDSLIQQLREEAALMARHEAWRTHALLDQAANWLSTLCRERLPPIVSEVDPPAPDVSGLSGFRIMQPTSSTVRDGERWEIYAPCGSGGIVREDDVKDWVVRKLLDALVKNEARS